MNIFEAFPTKYVSAADLRGQEITVTIDRVAMENLGDDNGAQEWKPVVYFVGMQKGLGLNKTNATSIANGFGTETDHWRGRQITLYPTETMYGGRQTPCIRVRIPHGQQGQQGQPAAAPNGFTPQQQPQQTVPPNGQPAGYQPAHQPNGGYQQPQQPAPAPTAPVADGQVRF